MKDNSYTPWPPGDDKRLAQLAKSGKTVPELARQFGRGEGAIRSRLKHLGLSQPGTNHTGVKTPIKTSAMPKGPSSVTSTKDLNVDPQHGRVRKHFATGLEISEDGEYVSKSYANSHSGATKRFSPDICTDSQGRKYISWSNKTVYIDEMVCTCFHGSPRPGQTVFHKNGKVADCDASNLKWA